MLSVRCTILVARWHFSEVVLKNSESSNIPPGVELDEEPLFFPVSLTKYGVMSICTLGLYEVFWMWKCWVYLRDRGRKASPVARAILLPPIYLYGLLKEIRAAGVDQDLKTPFSPAAVYAAWIFMFIAGALVDNQPFGWLSYLIGWLPLVPAIAYVNALNRASGRGASINSKFSRINCIGGVLGLAFAVTFLVYGYK